MSAPLLDTEGKIMAQHLKEMRGRGARGKTSNMTWSLSSLFSIYLSVECPCQGHESWHNPLYIIQPESSHKFEAIQTAQRSSWGVEHLSLILSNYAIKPS